MMPEDEYRNGCVSSASVLRGALHPQDGSADELICQGIVSKTNDERKEVTIYKSLRGAYELCRLASFSQISCCRPAPLQLREIDHYRWF
jgi:hypothetical protein